MRQIEVIVAFATCAIVGFWVSRRRVIYGLHKFIARRGGKRTGHVYLTGNFAPTDKEVHVKNLAVDGTVPAELDGVYMRNGPNSLLAPFANYHWFDGDGMIHATCFGADGVAYCNRYILTSRLKQERAAGHPLFIKMGDSYGWTGAILGMIKPLMSWLGVAWRGEGDGQANTALAYHANRLLAFNEGDLPYALRVLCSGVIETVRRAAFNGKWKGHFTAHPKLDPLTGELAALGYELQTKPFVRAGIIDPSGAVKVQWDVQTEYSTLMHDMALTKHYIVLLQTPLCFDVQHMVDKNALPFKFHAEKNAKFGLVRRDSPKCKPDVRWFDMQRAFVIMHAINAWEEDGGRIVKIYACEMSSISLDLDEHSGGLQNEDKARPTEYILDLEKGTVTSRRISETVADFPVTHPAGTSLPTRYAWLGTMDDNTITPNFDGIAKIDLFSPKGVDACVSRIAYPEGMKGGEPYFVPRNADGPLPPPEDEDDGFLMLYVHCEKRDVSFLHIYDAKTMDSKPLAIVTMPQRVPYGFHGMYMTRQQLKGQLEAAERATRSS